MKKRMPMKIPNTVVGAFCIAVGAKLVARHVASSNGDPASAIAGGVGLALGLALLLKGSDGHRPRVKRGALLEKLDTPLPAVVTLH